LGGLGERRKRLQSVEELEDDEDVIVIKSSILVTRELGESFAKVYFGDEASCALLKAIKTSQANGVGTHERLRALKEKTLHSILNDFRQLMHHYSWIPASFYHTCAKTLHAFLQNDREALFSLNDFLKNLKGPDRQIMRTLALTWLEWIMENDVSSTTT